MSDTSKRRGAVDRGRLTFIWRLHAILTHGTVTQAAHHQQASTCAKRLITAAPFSEQPLLGEVVARQLQRGGWAAGVPVLVFLAMDSDLEQTISPLCALGLSLENEDFGSDDLEGSSQVLCVLQGAGIVHAQRHRMIKF